MADNTTLDAGAGGDVIATDDIGGVKYQIVKTAFGALDTATLVTASVGLPVNIIAENAPVTVDWNGTAPPIGAGVEATALRVTLATDSTGLVSVDDNGGALTVDNGGTFAVQESGGALTALQIIDDWDETDRAKVNLIVGQAGVAGGSGVDGATVLRVSLATNVALPAGTNGIGKLTANSGVDIGDVDVTSISAGANLIGNVGIGVRTSGGMSIFRSLDIDETEEEIKATAGQVYSISAFNRTASPLYLKFYNDTAANVVVGTTTPVLTFVVPANADSDGAGFIWNNPIGLAFSTAITVAATTGVADSDTGAPGANDCVIDIGYA